MRHPGAIAVLLVWLLLCSCSLYFAWQFIAATDSQSSPVGNLNGGHQNEKFGKIISNTPIVILISALKQQSIKQSVILQNFSHLAASKIQQFEGVESVLGYFLPPNNPLIQERYIKDDKYTILVVNYVGNKSADCVTFIENQVLDVYQPPPNEFQLEITGLPVLIMDMASATVNDLQRMDAITIPLAICVLGLSLRRLPLLLLPIVTIFVSAITTFALLYVVALIIPVPTFVAATVMSISIALCIDYSLFLCSRYTEALKTGRSNAACVWQAVRRSGENILVSGSTIAVAFLGLAILPVQDIRSQGITASIGVILTVTANITIIPAMLLCFGHFFGATMDFKDLWERLSQKKQHVPIVDLDDALSTPQHPEKQPQDEQANSWFFRFSKYINRRPIAVISAVFLAGLPFMIAVLNIQLSFDVMSFAPKTSPAAQTIRHLQAVWGHGTIDPYYLVVETGHPGGVRSQAFWDASQQLLEYLNQTVSEVPIAHYDSIRMAQGRFVEPALRDILLAGKGDLAMAYQTLWNQTVDPLEDAMVFLIALPFDGISQKAVDWIRHMHTALDDFQDQISGEAKTYNMTLYGGACEQVGMLDSAIKDLPAMACITFGIIMLIVAVAFRSLVLPVIFILAMCYTLAVTFGLAVIVFGALQWTIPVMAFSVICGLALDYGVFLLTRVKEYRMDCFTDDAAIVKGVYKTGGVITSAGVIMFIAFGGLMLSQAKALNQFGLLLCFSVILDTFVIRCVLVPAMMTLTGPYTWWPGRVPEAYRGVEDMQSDAVVNLLGQDTSDEEDMPERRTTGRTAGVF